jgi:outer membrane protein
LPVFSLVGKYSQNKQPASLGLGEPQLPASSRDWYVGAQIRIPLFEGFGRSYKTSSAHAQAELQRDMLDEARQQVGLDVWKSYQALQTGKQNVVNSGTLAQVAQRSFDVARHRYAADVGNILELLSAQRALAEAKQQRIHALTDWRTARLQLAAKMGYLDSRDLPESHYSP